MKQQLAKMTALAGLITALVMAVVSAGQPTASHSTSNASGEVRTTTLMDEIEWP